MTTCYFETSPHGGFSKLAGPRRNHNVPFNFPLTTKEGCPPLSVPPPHGTGRSVAVLRVFLEMPRVLQSKHRLPSLRMRYLKRGHPTLFGALHGPKPEVDDVLWRSLAGLLSDEYAPQGCSVGCCPTDHVICVSRGLAFFFLTLPERG